MAIGQPRGKEGMRPVYVYNPAVGKKVYVGSRKKLRGEGGAEELFRDKTAEFARARDGEANGTTIAAWAAEWLTEHHGPGTSRPETGTHTTNEGNLRPFLAEFGHLPLKGGIKRRAALAWSRKHPHNAKTVSAMYNDAIDAEAEQDLVNPFANRKQQPRRERRFIKALTTEEVERLGKIALQVWGAEGFGLVMYALIMFGAWVGTRPGETYGVEKANLDFAHGKVTVKRIKKRGGKYPTDTIVLPHVAAAAIRAMPDLPDSGPIFLSIEGSPMGKGNLRYYWDPIRAAFRQTVTDERWAELLDGTEDGQHFDFYVLRHRVASHIVAQGGNEYDVAAQLGNSPEVCRATYIHDFADERLARNAKFLNNTADVLDLAQARDRRGA